MSRLSASLSAVNIFSERLEILERIRHGINHERNKTSLQDEPYSNWLAAELDLALSPSVAMKSEKDGTGLVEVSRRLPPQEIFNKYE